MIDGPLRDFVLQFGGKIIDRSRQHLHDIAHDIRIEIAIILIEADARRHLQDVLDRHTLVTALLQQRRIMIHRLVKFDLTVTHRIADKE